MGTNKTRNSAAAGANKTRNSQGYWLVEDATFTVDEATMQVEGGSQGVNKQRNS